MASSRRQLILEAFRTRLQAITTDAGFQTDAGKAVFLGEAPTFGPADPDAAIQIGVGDDVPISSQNTVVELPIEIAAIAKPDLDRPWEAIEAVIADIKTAVELADRTLGGRLPGSWQAFRRGPTRTLPRDPGSTTVGAAVEYRVTYTEKWGQP